MDPKLVRETKQMKELKEILPTLGQDDYGRLKESIKERGIQEAIKILPDGVIVDGYHRKKIAQELEIKDIPYEIKQLDKDEALELGISLNLARRNLSFEQKKEIIKKLRGRGWTQKRVAQVIGIPRRTLGDLENISNGEIAITYIPDLRYKISKKVEDEIFERSKTETQEEIASDHNITQPRVSQIIKKKKDQIHKKEDAKKKASQYKKEEGIEIFHGDFKKIAKQFPDNHFDHIITDPPYPEKYLPLWSDLSRIA
ncbi:unnamed protein product, partial [marine sediment metagenome]